MHPQNKGMARYLPAGRQGSVGAHDFKVLLSLKFGEIAHPDSYREVRAYNGEIAQLVRAHDS